MIQVFKLIIVTKNDKTEEFIILPLSERLRHSLAAGKCGVLMENVESKIIGIEASERSSRLSRNLGGSTFSESTFSESTFSESTFSESTFSESPLFSLIYVKSNT